jgi:hypothetical protein
LRHVPIPGLDVALGVTAYQIAEMSRVAALAAGGGWRTAARFGRALEEGLSGLWQLAGEVPQHGGEVALQAARGIIHAVDRTARIDAGDLARQAMLAVVRGLERSEVDAGDAIRGAGHGVVQGADEVRADVGQAAVQAVEGARQVASEAGISEEVAMAEAARGALDAAVALGPKAVAEVEASIRGEATAGGEGVKQGGEAPEDDSD